MMQISKKMVDLFFQRHYPENTVKKKELSTKVDPFSDNKIAAEERPIMSFLYHPSTIRVRKIIQSNWGLLQARIEVAKISIAINLWQPAARTSGTTPCNQGKCEMCPVICTAI